MKNHEQLISETVGRWHRDWNEQAWSEECDGLVVVNILGQIACTTEADNGVIRITDCWDNGALIPKPKGKFVEKHMLPRLLEAEETSGEVDRPVEVNNFAACWMFLDGSITPEDVARSRELKFVDRKEWSANGHEMITWERLGMQIRATIMERDVVLQVLHRKHFRGGRDDVFLGWKNRIVT